MIHIVPVLIICPHICCWNWYVVSLWIWITETLHLAFQWNLRAVICSYYLDPPCGWARLTNLIFFSALKTLSNIFISSVMMTCMTVTWHCYANQFYGWIRILNLICFFTWNTLRFIFIATVLMICPHSCCWRWNIVLMSICAIESSHLASQRLSVASICSYYLDLPLGRSRMANLMYLVTWMSSRKFLIIPMVKICPRSCC